MSSSTKRKRAENETRLSGHPASYWVSIGFDENDAKRMERLQETLLENSSNTLGTLQRYTFGCVIPYHEMMLPYWKTYAKAGVNGDPLGEFRARQVQLPSEVWQIITPKLSSIKTLELNNNDMNAEAIYSLSSFLTKNNTLEKLSFELNHITDLGAARALSLAMKNHPTLQEFDAVYCGFGGNYAMDDPDPGQPEIAKAIIDGCENLVKVSMCRVGMDDSCAASYASMIKRNKKLRNLFIYWEYFSMEGLAKIATGVYDPSSLNAMADANHKCTIYDSESLDNPNQDVSTKILYVNGLSCPDAMKIRYKVQRTLFGVGREPFVMTGDDPTEIIAEEGKEIDLSYFGGIPLELVPKVLEYLLKERIVVGHEYASDGYYIKRSWFMHYEEDGKEYLNRLFQTFKGWVVPRIFGN